MRHAQVWCVNRLSSGLSCGRHLTPKQESFLPLLSQKCSANKQLKSIQKLGSESKTQHGKTHWTLFKSYVAYVRLRLQCPMLSVSDS